jgi:hypothetical protein
VNITRSTVGASSRTLIVVLALSGASWQAARAQTAVPSPPERPVEFKQAPPVMPQPRPAELGGVAQVTEAASPEKAQPGSPEKTNGAPSPASNVGTGQPSPTSTQPVQDAELPQDEMECRERLAATGTTFKPLPPIVEGACGAPFPLELSMLPDGVAVSPPVTLTCRASEALARWTRDSVLGEADARLRRRPIRLLAGTSYQCRGVNHNPAARLSEHAFANGLDLAGFAFDGETRMMIGTQKPGSAEEGFQSAVRASACSFFATVLGPGTEAHGEHLHVDMRGRNNGYSICQ